MNLVEGQGLPDFIMLDDIKVNEAGFMQNLKHRFDQKQIYTYIGEQLVSLNPFQPMPHLYDEKTMKSYQDRYLYEVQPHIYALADETFRALMQTKVDQCVIITGESGAGKTEASKIFMQYISRISSGGVKGEAEIIKQRLLDSNPILESFGNAKTIRNDNSSRFGKYMEIQFDGAGAPLGGKISQYLLEKSRVVVRASGERSFHVFYMLLKQNDVCAKYDLQPTPSDYEYLALSECYEIAHQDDKKEWAVMTRAMDTLGFTAQNKDSIWRVLAAILHLGNIEYKDVNQNATDSSQIVSTKEVEIVAKHLQVDQATLDRCLTTRTITSGATRRSSAIIVPLNSKQAINCRNSFAKSLYNAVFHLVTETLNRSLAVGDKKAEVVTGVLDIYGFEIFVQNSFEQFCINYCNEKLQQIFIKLVLKAEQEEYIKEGIEWKEIDYFNNGPIVELIEGKSGIFKKLDEACMIGDVTPKQLLEKFDHDFMLNPHYDSYQKSKGKISGERFQIKHYAGVVDYEIAEFAEKNRDTLFTGLKKMLQASKDPLIQNFFPVSDDIAAEKKRPPTAGIQFATSVNALVTTLLQCQPHYIRCIKSNEVKKPMNFDEKNVAHQVRYLNLVETVRVRRAGFCNRQQYSHFMRRYKMLTPKTWPSWKGSEMEGTTVILDDIGIKPDEYRKGKTKLFVRDAQTLFKFERARADQMPKVAIAVQRRYRGHEGRTDFQKRQLAVTVQRLWRGYKARKQYKTIKTAFLLQRNYRASKGRHIAATAKAQAHRKANAALIQKHCRGYLQRKYYAANKERLRKEREEAIRRTKNQLAIHLQALWRHRVACVETKRLAAALEIERYYRFYIRRRYINRLAEVVSGSVMKEEKSNFGKELKFPGYKPAPLTPAEEAFKKMQHFWWGHNKIASLDQAANHYMRQKVMALQLFRGKKPWDSDRQFLGDYNDLKTNPHVDAYKKTIAFLFQAGGDSHISFSDDVIKVNKRGAAQVQNLVVTNATIYKYTQGKYKMIKEGSPLSAVKGIHLSPLADTFIVIEMAPPHRDYVLDLGNHNVERVSELATILYKARMDQGQIIPVTFGDTITFNNSRTAKEPGHVVTLKFEKHPKPTPGCKFVGPKNNTATVFYP